ncbi:thioredoxin family protein [Corticicoccus populi]|uniref:Thioredoxin family protein n=1 Tax=Corticicoccus populi TaxID=1812821 RepID=A0ABW5WUK9_9STAP
MMKQELDTRDLYNLIQSEDRVIVFGYAPICANCQIAERMLNVAKEVVGFEYTPVDLNYHEAFINEFHVQSAPALLVFERGELIRSVYAFESVTKLVEILQK